MNVTSAPEVLRPLSLGELLDRGVTLCVRFFLPLASLYAVFAVPYGFAQYFATRDLQKTFAIVGQMIRIQTVGGRPLDPTALSAILAHYPVFTPSLALLLLANFLIAPLPLAALIQSTSAFYLGSRPTFGQAYRVALERWLPLIGLNFLYLGAGIGLYVVVTIVLFVLILGVAFLAMAAHGVGIALATVVGLGAFLAVIAVAVIFLLALETSYFTCVVEHAPALRAFSVGIARVLGRVGLRRALFVGSAYFAISLGVFVASAVGNALIVGLVHSPVVSAVYTLLLRIAVVTFLSAFFAIFYFDLRVREEGLDLQVAAQQAAPLADA
ncbi:MAG: hypothetical protein GIW94_01905 [Candidatus Eremiobacteraeota bacterium]|nr:hypothetical protein [Candidatus Eremiobacteraeota bacterium]MBC5822285.1 hypothetical protein [Candidatus Eremiobacteraeota bacterium]